MQNPNLKSQSDNSNFKTDFTKRLIRYSLDVIKLCTELREKKKVIVIADQLVRSSTSIGANVVEAKSASSKKEYIRYFEIALKSANESKYWLLLLRESDQEYNEIAEALLRETVEIAKILASGTITMKGKKF